MSDHWRNKEYIEGEYEVLEERDFHQGQDRPPFRQPLHVDNSPPYVTYVFRFEYCGFSLDELVRTVLWFESK